MPESKTTRAFDASLLTGGPGLQCFKIAMLNRDLMQIVKDAFSTYTFREFRRNHETYEFIKSLSLPPRMHLFSPSKDFSIL